jgi:Rieske Fe-S protein
MEEKNINRRDFIKSSFVTIALGTVAFSALDITSLLAKASEKFNTETPEKVINLSDYPELQSVGGYAMVSKLVIVIRVSQSKFVALNITCTHKKCDVEYDGSGFECPCHGSQFNKYGKVTEGPAKNNLKSYKTEYNFDDDTLTIKM